MESTHECGTSLNDWRDKGYAGTVQHLAWQNFVRTSHFSEILTGMAPSTSRGLPPALTEIYSVKPIPIPDYSRSSSDAGV